MRYYIRELAFKHFPSPEHLVVADDSRTGSGSRAGPPAPRRAVRSRPWPVRAEVRWAVPGVISVRRRPGRVSSFRPGPACAGPACAGQSCAGQSCAGQSCAGQSCAGQSCAGQSCAGQSCAGNPVPGQPTLSQPAPGSPDQRCEPSSPAPHRPGRSRPATGHPGPGHRDPTAPSGEAGDPPVPGGDADAWWEGDELVDEDDLEAAGWADPPGEPLDEQAVRAARAASISAEVLGAGFWPRAGAGPGGLVPGRGRGPGRSSGRGRGSGPGMTWTNWRRARRWPG